MSRLVDWKAAWQQCYDYFGFSDADFDEEVASLRLAFYLAIFGMFRASGKLRTIQLEDFSQLVAEARQYRTLRDRSPAELAERQNEVESLLSALRVRIGKLKVSSTDTLVTKIALATTACVPAYDRFAVRALWHHGLIGTPSAAGLAQIFALRRSDLRRFGASFAKGEPFMRSLDRGLMKMGESL